MSKGKYRYNPDTLRYEKIVLSFSDKIKKGIKYILLFILLGSFINAFLYFSDLYPNIYLLRKENNTYNIKFSKLNNRIETIKDNLANIQQNDDNLYRPIFDIEPISSSIRMAGYGGAYNYELLEGFKSSGLMIKTTQNLEEILKQVYIQSLSYDQVIIKLMEKENFYSCRPSIQPISDNDYIRISDPFGWRIDPFTGKAAEHHGIDFAGDPGGKIISTGKGIVVKAGYSFFGYGNLIEIDHGFGYKTKYAHLEKIYVKEGEKVERGKVIGLLGNTGRSTGAHLHYEVNIFNTPVNPEYFFNNDISPEEYAKIVALAN